MKPLALATGACMVATAQAFALLPPQTTSTFRTMTTTPTSPTKQSHTSLAFAMEESLALIPLEEVLSDSTLLQDEFCNGMVHALLDFAGLLFGGNDAATKVRLAAVLGRLFVIGQDVQHEVLPDELAVQLGLLGLACNGLAKTLVPKLKAKFSTPTLMTPKDRQAFRTLFRPAGLSWVDFRELYSESMDWVRVEPGHVLWKDNGEEEGEDAAVYWLYQGDVQIWSHDSQIYTICGRQEVAGIGLFGEDQLAKLLDSRDSSAKQDKKKPTGLKAVAGEGGATVLRMNVGKLEKFLRHNQELTHAVHRLAFMGMQDKLDALLLKEQATP